MIFWLQSTDLRDWILKKREREKLVETEKGKGMIRALNVVIQGLGRWFIRNECHEVIQKKANDAINLAYSSREAYSQLFRSISISVTFEGRYNDMFQTWKYGWTKVNVHRSLFKATASRRSFNIETRISNGSPGKDLHHVEKSRLNATNVSSYVNHRHEEGEEKGDLREEGRGRCCILSPSSSSTHSSSETTCEEELSWTIAAR